MGDALETMARVIDFEALRPVLETALSYSSGSKGGRPPYDAVAMLKILILVAQHNVSDERMEFLIRDRLSWLRFLGFDLGRPTPDENKIRSFVVIDSARHDGALLRELVTTNNTASDVWADKAYRSKANEAWLAARGRVLRIHHRNPKGRPMAERMYRANARKSAVRAAVEHIFAHQKGRMGLFVRTIGKVRAEAKIGLVNLAHNFQRLILHQRRDATG